MCRPHSSSPFSIIISLLNSLLLIFSAPVSFFITFPLLLCTRLSWRALGFELFFPVLWPVLWDELPDPWVDPSPNTPREICRKKP